MSYSEVTGIRNRLKAYVGEGLSVEATKVDQEQGLYDVLKDCLELGEAPDHQANHGDFDHRLT